MHITNVLSLGIAEKIPRRDLLMVVWIFFFFFLKNTAYMLIQEFAPCAMVITFICA